MKKHISVLIKPSSSLCNIRCKYCFYMDICSKRNTNSFGHMTSDTARKLIENIYIDLNNGDNLTIGFQGGEPTLVGIDYFFYFLETVKKQPKQVNVNYFLQTNGMLITEKWCNLLKENNFLVGLSIDGPSEFHDENRIHQNKKGTFKRVMKTKSLLDLYKIDYNVLCVLTSNLSKNPREVFYFFKKEKVNYIQFIPCLSDLNVEKNEFSITPQAFLIFYKEYFDLWYNDLKNGIYQSVKLFDDIIQYFVNGRISACGINGKCQIQYVIEANGNVYPCDFYAIDEYLMGNIRENTIKELFYKKVAFKFVNSKKNLPKYCMNCPFLNKCYGGCKRMKNEVYVSKNEDFCGYREFLNIFLKEVKNILILIKHANFLKN